ncbi:MAG: PAS domain-containing protein, partial [Candidatus Thorarchaeota archaeon]
MSEDPKDRNQETDPKSEYLGYEDLVASMNDAFGIIDSKGVLTYVNQKFSQLLEYPMEEMIGKPITNFVDEENVFILQNNIRVRTEGKSSVYELEWT